MVNILVAGFLALAGWCIYLTTNLSIEATRTGLEPTVILKHGSNLCGVMCDVMCCVCVCVPYDAVVCAAISNREVAGSIPDDYGHTRLSSLSQTPPDFSIILLDGYPTASACQSMWCDVCAGKK